MPVVIDGEDPEGNYTGPIWGTPANLANPDYGGTTPITEAADGSKDPNTGIDPNDPFFQAHVRAAAAKEAMDQAQKEWDDYWNSLDPWAQAALLKQYGQEQLDDPAIQAAIRQAQYAEWGPEGPPTVGSNYDDYPFEDKIKQYIETKDPALKAEIEAAVWNVAVYWAMTSADAGDDAGVTDMQNWYDEMNGLMKDIDAGLYDPYPEDSIPDDYGEYYDQEPAGGGGGGGRKGDSGPSDAAKQYQAQARYFHDYGADVTSGYLRRRRARSQAVRRFRLRKAKWIDPYPWIPGTGPEKQVFEVLVRRGIYFIFQGQAPELEEGQYSTMAVPNFEPDFVLPQYKIILDPFSPFHHSLPGAVQRDAQKVALYESIGYRYYHPWALGPGEWSFDQVGVNHGRFTTEEMLNQIPEFSRPPGKLPDRELPYVGQGFRLGQNLGAGANSVAAANRARVKARTLLFMRGIGSGVRRGGPKIPRRPVRRTL